MAKAKKPAQPKKTLADKVIGLPLLLLVTVSALGFIIYRHVQQQHQKQAFTQVEQALKDFSLQVEQKLGQPSQKETKSYCNRTSEKYKKGKLYCGVRTGMNYPTLFLDEAKADTFKVEELLRKEGLFTTISLKNEDNSPDSWQRELNIKTKYLEIGLWCNAEFNYQDKTTQYTGTYIGDPKPGTFSFIIRCTDYASRQYYPDGY